MSNSRLPTFETRIDGSVVFSTYGEVEGTDYRCYKVQPSDSEIIGFLKGMLLNILAVNKSSFVITGNRVQACYVQGGIREIVLPEFLVPLAQELARYAREEAD